jgi:hypothetical protein
LSFAICSEFGNVLVGFIFTFAIGFGLPEITTIGIQFCCFCLCRYRNILRSNLTPELNMLHGNLEFSKDSCAYTNGYLLKSGSYICFYFCNFLVGIRRLLLFVTCLWDCKYVQFPDKEIYIR